MSQKLEHAEDQSSRRCSFCKTSEAEAGRLVEGPSTGSAPAVYICAACVERCSDTLERQKQKLEPAADGSAHDAVADAALALSRQIDQAVKNLDDLEFRIIELRYGLADGHSHSHEEVAKALELTPEKVQEIEAAAVAKLVPPS
jgi:DNA-directed RNA polymerase specialized sigma24 family protein